MYPRADSSYAKAHCRLVASNDATVWTDATVDPRGNIKVTPVVAETQRWRCPKDAPSGIDGQLGDSDLADKVPRPDALRETEECQEVDPSDGGTPDAAPRAGGSDAARYVP
jgi:hypothetical protein